jgi:hypothetical protein
MVSARWPAVSVVLLFAGCGYVGDPLPPALNVPERVADLGAVQRGDQIEVSFTVPAVTTDGIGLRLSGVELRVAPSDPGGNIDEWSRSAEAYEIGGAAPGEPQTYRLSITPWASKQIWLAVRVASHRHKWSGWSNPTSLEVVSEIKPPAGLKTEAVAEGVRLRWSHPENRDRLRTRVWKKSRSSREFIEAATVDGTEWVDTETKYGEAYEYAVQALVGGAESLRGAIAGIAPSDRFPPSPPAGVTAIASAGAVELAWNPNRESDTAGYRVYRAAGDGPMSLIGDKVATPSYRDTTVTAGTKYKYRISAVDSDENESAPSQPVDVEAQ